MRVPIRNGAAWFKVCGPVQAFETTLTAELFSRWPGLVPEVLGWNSDRSWLLLADAGTPIGASGNPPETWRTLLPAYAELQRREADHTPTHLINGVPDLRVVVLPERYQELLSEELPLKAAEVVRLREFAPHFSDLCAELGEAGLPDTIQHDDLHMNNVFRDGQGLRILDWGDACISHPFVSLVATFRFLEERNRLGRHDPWFETLRDAYLESWGGVGYADLFSLAHQVGVFAYAIAALRQREALSDTERIRFDEDFSVRLRRALSTVDSG
jgi:hypothetical protein